MANMSYIARGSWRARLGLCGGNFLECGNSCLNVISVWVLVRLGPLYIYRYRYTSVLHNSNSDKQKCCQAKMCPCLIGAYLEKSGRIIQNFDSRWPSSIADEIWKARKRDIEHKCTEDSPTLLLLINQESDLGVATTYLSS